jgi:WD40 repeat protein
VSLLHSYDLKGKVTSLAWSPDGKYLAAASLLTDLYGVETYGDISIWEVELDRLLLVYKGHLARVNALAWSPDGKHIASASADGSVQIWLAPSSEYIPDRYEEVFLARPKTDLLGVAWVLNGKYIAAAAENGLVYVWEHKPDKPLTVYRAGVDEAFYTYQSYGFTMDISCLPGSSYIASISSGWEGTIHLWYIPQHPSSVEKLHPVILSQPDVSLFTICWSPDGKFLATAADRYSVGTVEIWDSVRREHLATYFDSDTGTYKESYSRVNAVAWSPDGKRIASAWADGTVQVFDPLTGENVFIYRGHRETVLDVAWCPDGTCLASASADGTVHIWHDREATTSQQMLP